MPLQHSMYLIKKQSEGPFSFPSKFAQAVCPFACKQRDWRAAAVAASAGQGSGDKGLARTRSSVKQYAPEPSKQPLMLSCKH